MPIIFKIKVLSLHREVNIINPLKTVKIMVNYSKLLNANFLCKIGRCLYGYAGACRILGEKLVQSILLKALRSKKQVFRYKATKAGVMVYLYSR